MKAEEEVERVVTNDLNVDRHMNVNVTSSGQGTKTVILQIPKVRYRREDFIDLNVSVTGHQVRRDRREAEERRRRI